MPRPRLVTSALVAALTCLGTIAVPLVGSGRDASATPAGIRCGSDPLTVSWRGATGGLAGTGGDLIWVRNRGSRACLVRGYPTVSFADHGRRVALSPLTRPGHEGNDDFGIRPGTRPPAIRLAAHGGLASFWVFGQDVNEPCPVATQMVVSVPGLAGRAVLATPSAYESWPICGPTFVVNPLVAGASGRVPPVALSSVLMVQP